MRRIKLRSSTQVLNKDIQTTQINRSRTFLDKRKKAPPIQNTDYLSSIHSTLRKQSSNHKSASQEVSNLY